MSICLLIRPDTRALFRQLDSLAASAEYDTQHLDQFRSSSTVYRCRETVYYLASLYLHVGNTSAADELLSRFDTASVVMKRYFHVLAYSIRCHLPVPKLSTHEMRCVGFLEERLNPASDTLEESVLKSCGFSVVGNAPGASFMNPHIGTRFYFNSYASNSRISEDASIHVVTPSWNKKLTKSADAICITGNDIFFRRSRVWQKFKSDDNYDAIFTVPANLWNSLYNELSTSPSAGLLILGLMKSIADKYPGKLSGYVAGFSNGKPDVNHHYDAVPASTRHDWEAEAVVRQRLLHALNISCSSLIVES